MDTGKVAVAVLCLTGIAVWRAKRPGVMTEERDRVYRMALNGNPSSPDKLRQLAVEFEKERLFPQAQLLRQRAALRELPEDVKEKRKTAFRKGMASNDKLGVLRLADAFEREGCTSAAARLRERASGLPDVAPSAAPIVTPPPADVPVSTPDSEEEVETAPVEVVESPAKVLNGHAAQA